MPDSDAFARRQGAAYIVQRGGRASWNQTDLNMWFRLILIGGGGTFQKMRWFGARGTDRPHHQADRSGVGPLGSHFG
jgi:hypothetical protein